MVVVVDYVVVVVDVGGGVVVVDDDVSKLQRKRKQVQSSGNRERACVGVHVYVCVRAKVHKKHVCFFQFV